MNRRKNQLQGYHIFLPYVGEWNNTADYLKQTALRLKDRNTVIAFQLESIRFPIAIYRLLMRTLFASKNRIHYFTFIQFLPFVRFPIIRSMNIKLNVYFILICMGDILKNRRYLIWMFHPNCFEFFLYFPFDKISVYDGVDYFWMPDEIENGRIRSDENRLIRSSDYVFVISRVLKTRYQSIRSDIHIVPQGFSVPERDIQPHSFGTLPVVGYVGAINNRLDYPLLRHLIVENPEITFVFWGPITDDGDGKVKRWVEVLSDYPNVLFGSSIDRNDVYSIIQGFTVGIIPYVDTPFNRYCYPMKLFEYFYYGKPVISSYILELTRYPKYVTIAVNELSWCTAIRTVLNSPWTQIRRDKQRRLSLANTWERKISTMYNRTSRHNV